MKPEPPDTPAPMPATPQPPANPDLPDAPEPPQASPLPARPSLGPRPPIAFKRLRKPRCDARLKNLPHDDQARLIAWLDGPEGYAGARRLVAQQLGFQTSLAALSDFHSWWRLRCYLEQADCFARGLEHTLVALTNFRRAKHRITQSIQLVLELKALKEQDTGSFSLLRRLGQRDDELRLQARRFALKRPAKAPPPLSRNSLKYGGIPAEILRQIEQELKLL